MSFVVGNILDTYCKNNMAVPFADPIKGEYKSVYLPFQATGLYSQGIQKSYYFQPDHLLDGDNAIIKGIELVTASMAQSFFGQGVIRDNMPPFPDASLSTGVLYMSNTKREILATIPLIDLARQQNDGKLLRTYFTEHLWQNCYIEFVNPAVVSATTGIQLIVYYEERKK
jgi:hypothetical protein